MDGILVLILIGWLLSKMSKKGKKNKRTVFESSRANSAQVRAERIAKLRLEAEKKKIQLSDETISAPAPAAAEGESSVPYIQPEEVFRGSLQSESLEGECICDPELEHERIAEPAPESVYAGEIGKEPLLDFSPRGMMQGIVMSEILTRPVQRSRRR